MEPTPASKSSVQASRIDLAIRSVRRKAAKSCSSATSSRTRPSRLQEVVTRQLTLKGSCSCAGEYPEAIRRIEDGSIQVPAPAQRHRPAQAKARSGSIKATQPGNGLLKVVLTP